MTFDANALVSLHGTANIQNRLALPGRNAEDIILDRAVSEQELARIADTIARSPAVEYAVPEKIERIQQVNDPRYAEQWDYFKAATGIRLPQAWNHSGGKNVVVAVLDTGVRKHADLIGRLLDGYDMVEDLTRSNDGNGRDPDPTDPGDWCPSEFDSKSSWHGTHVAGTISAVRNNNLGGTGVAPEASILPVRVLGRCGGSSFDIADGIRWAAGVQVAGVPDNPTPAQVINLSLGGPGACDSDYADAIRAARLRGATVVVAAGNSDIDAAGFRPANCEGVVSVAATNVDGARAYFGRRGAGSNFGTSVKIAAPGGETLILTNGILSTLNDGIRDPGNDSYQFYQGTSMAAPHVAGVLALMYAVYPTMKPDEALSILRSTSQPFPTVASRQCDTSTCGAGIVNAEAAVVEAATRGSRVAATTPTSTSTSRP
ncbi:S8 family peptidase [Bradyrhizobium liaoningense]|uniref:S8 family peptidase n=1 Tax=Bradyrhizobium liaoningense TaxID=43992 RepID=UPI00192A7E70|nr:S8 family peptidase [Bradyrhizobium liaoningense]